MTTQPESNSRAPKCNPPIGFAGLASLVSDVAADVASVPDLTPQTATMPARPVSASGPVPVKQSGRTPGWLRGVILTVAVMVALGIFSAWCGVERTPRSSVVSSSSSSARPAMPAPAAREPVLLVEGLPSLGVIAPPSESLPAFKPAALDLRLDVSGIRWCLFQRERLDAARGISDQMNDQMIARFNALVAEYNGCCQRFQYRERDLKTVEKDVESRRVLLQEEGRAMVGGRRGDTRAALAKASTEFSLDATLLQAVVDVGRKTPAACGQKRKGPLLVSESAVRVAGGYDDLDGDRGVSVGARRLRSHANGQKGDAALALAAYCMDMPLGSEVASVSPGAERFVRDVAGRYRALRQSQERDVAEPKRGLPRRDSSCPEDMVLLRCGGPTPSSPFCIDRTEVSVRDFERCVARGVCLSANASCDSFSNYGVPGRLDHPMNCSAWSDANDYCRWAGKRLPSAAEWAWAARGGEAQSIFPWGNTQPSGDICWHRGDGPQAQWLGSCPIGSSKVDETPQGVRDMGGNVGEWTETLGPDGKSRILVGGGWADGDAVHGMSADWTMPFEPSRRHSVIGFRCAKNAPAPK